MERRFGLAPVQRIDWNAPKFLVMEFQMEHGKTQTMINHWERLCETEESAKALILELQA